MAKQTICLSKTTQALKYNHLTTDPNILGYLFHFVFFFLKRKEVMTFVSETVHCTFVMAILFK